MVAEAAVTGPSGGDSPLTSPEAVLRACRDAVAAAVTVNNTVQQAQGRWHDGGPPEPSTQWATRASKAWPAVTGLASECSPAARPRRRSAATIYTR
jgi:hypothetical protein